MKYNTLIVAKKIVIAIIGIIAIYACQDEKSEYLKSHVGCLYEISYKKDSIIINSINSNQAPLKLYFSKGSYLCENDRNLFLSIKKDTTFEALDDCHLRYLTQIKKCKDGEYCTSKFRIFQDGSRFYLFTFYYDVNYKILRIRKSMSVEFY